MGVIGSIVAGIAGYLGASGAAAAAIGTAVNLGLAAFSIASSMGAAKEQRQAAERARLADIQRNSFRNFRQPLTPRRIVFGRCRVAGPIIFAHNRKNHGTHLVVALASHEIEEIESVWMLEDQLEFRREAPHLARVTTKAYASCLLIQVFTGTSSQDIGQKMRAATDTRPGVKAISLDPLIVETADKFRGIAAIYAITRAWTQFFPSDTPEFAAIVKGNNQIYDPRTETAGYTANPALCTAWYLTEIMGFPTSSIDQPALIIAADICDETVELKSGGAELRYQCHGVITADMQHREVLALLARSMAGTVRYASGTWIINAGAPVAPALAFTEAHCLDGYEVIFDAPDRSLPNAVRGSHVDRNTWQPRAYPQRQLAAAVTAEGGPWWLDIDLPLTTSSPMAQRIAKIELARARARRRLSIELDLRGLAAMPGDVITFSAPDIGMAPATFEVDAFSFSRREGRGGPVLGTRLDLIEYSADTFAWTPVDDELAGDDGDASPGGYVNSAPEDACYNELGLWLEPPGRWQADYHLQWTDPDMEDLPLDFIRAEIRVTILWSYDDGLGGPPVERTTVATRTTDVNVGAEVLAADDLIDEPGTGYTYISHSPAVTLRAFFADGNASGPSPLETCPIPEPDYPETLIATPSGFSGIFPEDTFNRVSVDDFTVAYWGATTTDWRILLDRITGTAAIYFIGASDTAVRASGTPANLYGVYASTPQGEIDYNGGVPFTLTVA